MEAEWVLPGMVLAAAARLCRPLFRGENAEGRSSPAVQQRKGSGAGNSPPTRPADARCSQTVRSVRKLRAEVTRFPNRLLRVMWRLRGSGLVAPELLVQLAVVGALRVLLSLWLASIGAAAMQHFVSRRWSSLRRKLTEFFFTGTLAAAVGNLVRLCEGRLAAAMRQALAAAMLRDGVDSDKYAVGSSGLGNIARDTKAICDDLSSVLSNQNQRILETVFYALALGKRLGWQGPLSILVYLVGHNFLRSAVRQYSASAQSKAAVAETVLRESEARVAQHAEEIAFLDGKGRELARADALLEAATQDGEAARRRRYPAGIAHSLIGKYWLSFAGYLALSAPYYFDRQSVRHHMADVMARDYILCTQHITSLCQAVEALASPESWRLKSIAAATDRLHEVLEAQRATDAVATGVVFAEPAPPPSLPAAASAPSDAAVDAWDLRTQSTEWRACRRRIHERLNRALAATVASRSAGTVEWGPDIHVEKGEFTTPTGGFVTGLEFDVPAGTGVLVLAEHSELIAAFLRGIGGLSPLKASKATLPLSEDFLTLPEEPYLFRGTLAEQLVYPHTDEHIKQLNVTDDDLARVLGLADPRQEILTVHALDSERDWGAESVPLSWRQRLGLARILYHRPRFVALREGCFSALGDDAAHSICQVFQKLRVGVFRLSARQREWMDTDQVLHLDGKGAWVGRGGAGA